MNVNRVCHIVFCGRLEARFPGRAILYTTCPGLGLAEPNKSRLFSLLTVHSRPPFPFTFCFLPPVNSGGTAGTVFCPVGFWEKGLSAYSAAFRVLIPERKKLSAGRCRCPHHQGQCSCRPHSNSTPDGSERSPVSSVPVSCGKGNRPACVPAAASLYRGYLSCVPSILLSVAVPPKRFPAPFLRRVPALARSPQLRDNLSRSDLWTKCPEVGSLRCFPCRGIPFRTVIWFSRCSSSMNYPKSTPK